MAHRAPEKPQEAEVKFLGYLAEFDSPVKLLKASEQVRLAGYRETDAYTPFPVHGIDDALGIKRTKLPFLVLAVGLSACVFGVALQWFVNATDDIGPFPGYEFLISGKPMWSVPANMPVAFEIIVLSSAFAAFLGMWGMNRLPQFSNPLFRIDRFRRATQDRFFVMVGANDPIFDETQTREQLESYGALNVERVEHDLSDAKLPKVLQPIVWCLLVLALLPPALIYRARGMTNPLPRLHVNPDMDWQDKSKTQTVSPLREVATESPTFLFVDGRAMRPDVAGSVARGELDTDDAFFRGYAEGSAPAPDAAPGPDGQPAEPQWLTQFPSQVPVTQETLQRGEQRYNIYCATCHGLSGFGDGLITRRAMQLNAQGAAAWTQTKSLHDPAVQQQPIGRIFDTITNGRNSMGPYRDQIPVEDRWAIVLYVQALQAMQTESLTQDNSQNRDGQVVSQ